MIVRNTNEPANVARRVALPGGRQLGYRVLGEPRGLPVLFFHGWPGSSAEACFLEPFVERHDVWIVAVDRPGTGDSEPDPGRTLLSWVDDVRHLVDELAIGEFAILACSGGTPYALACGQRMPDRVSAIALASPLGPTWDPALRRRLPVRHRAAFTLARRPGLLRSVLRPASRVASRPTESARARLLLLTLGLFKPRRDRLALRRAGVWQSKLDAGREAFVRGHEGPAQDLGLLLSPWGFDPFDMPIPTRIWHGNLDTTVPVAASRFYEERLPVVSAKYLVDGGHTSVFVDHAPEMLVWLRETASARTPHVSLS